MPLTPKQQDGSLSWVDITREIDQEITFTFSNGEKFGFILSTEMWRCDIAKAFRQLADALEKE